MNSNKPQDTRLTATPNSPLSLPPRPGFYRTRRPKSVLTLADYLALDPDQLAKLVAEAGPDGTISVMKGKRGAGYKRKPKTEVGRHLVEREDDRGLPIILIEATYSDGSADVAKYK